jgi:glycosyltransferase involved in cell wall biosynthesis
MGRSSSNFSKIKMSISKTISIIIPVYNSESYLEPTLESILLQSFEDWECILVDDGSTMETIKIIKQYTKKDNRFKIFRRPNSRLKGANACRNYGFEKSEGKYIQWFDADDLMNKEMLKLKVELLNTSEADFVLCEGYIFKNHPENIIGTWDKLASPNPLLDHALGKINFQTNAPMFRRKFLENKKLWNEKLQRKQDYEFFSRLLSLKPTYEVIEHPLFYYRIHPESINGKNNPKQLPSMIRADLLVFQNIKKSNNFSEEMISLQRHFLRKIFGKFKLGINNIQPKVILVATTAILQLIDIKYLKNHFLVGK